MIYEIAWSVYIIFGRTRALKKKMYTNVLRNIRVESLNCNTAIKTRLSVYVTEVITTERNQQ